MRRADALGLIMLYAFETGKLNVRLSISNRISIQRAQEAAAKGMRLREHHGIKPGQIVNASNYKLF